MATVFRGSTSGLSRQRLRAKRYTRLHRDVYVDAAVPVALGVACDGVRAALPDAVMSHLSAASLLGLPVDAAPDLHITRPPGAALSRRHGVITHRGTLTPVEVTVRGGRRVTSPVRTFLDLAPHLDEVALVVLGDAVAARCGKDRLVGAVAAAPGRRGVIAARKAVALVDQLSDSPGETRTRLVLHGAGFTGLRHAVDMSDEGGGWLARLVLGDLRPGWESSTTGWSTSTAVRSGGAATSTATSSPVRRAGRSSYSPHWTCATRSG